VLRRPLISQGRIHVRGSQTRWTTLSPRPSAMSTSATEIHLYYPDQKVMEIYPLDRRLSELVASPLPSMTMLRRHFDITPSAADQTGLSATQDVEQPIYLRLTPRDEQIAEHVQRIDVLVDASTGLARVMAMINAVDERTVVEFTDIVVNPGLKDEDLQIQTPAGTRTVRPLEAGSVP
jgi:outer membrane lipoprotein-sorting protein